MSSGTSTFNIAAQARRAASAAAERAGVSVTEVEEMEALREVCRLFEEVWGRTPEGVPIPSDVLRSLAHSGGSVTAAYDGDGSLAGAAVAVLSAPAGSAYSLIAAARAGLGDRGIGYAVKQHQRAWALEHDLDAISWTFDPLVGRNARFNLTKLGAEAHEYVESFYGRMADDINGVDDADRLVASWALGSRKAVACSEGTAAEPDDPDLGSAEVRDTGPDGEPAFVATGRVWWCRVPSDIVALRRQQPRAASAWRSAVREYFSDALGSGRTATAMTRSGWYQLTPRGSR